MNNNNDVAGYLPDIRDNVSDYSDSEKEELIYKLLDEREEMMKKNKVLEKKACTDAMTGLNDSGEFYDALSENVSRANRGGEFSILMIDLNDFKGVNDNYGHKKGDEVLKKVSRVLENSIREHDKAFRYGGDEFALQLEDSNIEESLEAAERIYAEVMELDVWDEIDREKADYGLSIGAVEYRGESSYDVKTTADTLYQLADDAMYFAKESQSSDIAFASYEEEFFDGVPAYTVGASSEL